eukprot:3622621-Heterocapsa_arctica.AAC.1
MLTPISRRKPYQRKRGIRVGSECHPEEDPFPPIHITAENGSDTESSPHTPTGTVPKGSRKGKGKGGKGVRQNGKGRGKSNNPAKPNKIEKAPFRITQAASAKERKGRTKEAQDCLPSQDDVSHASATQPPSQPATQPTIYESFRKSTNSLDGWKKCSFDITFRWHPHCQRSSEGTLWNATRHDYSM